MKKVLTLAAIALSMFFLTACDSMDGPSPLDTRASGSANELNPDNLPGDSSMADAGLPGRGINDMGGFDPDNIKPEDIVETIYFGFDQYAVAAGEREKIKKAADFYASNPDFKVVLVGHTDWYGTEEYNILLSDKTPARRFRITRHASDLIPAASKSSPAAKPVRLSMSPRTPPKPRGTGASKS